MKKSVPLSDLDYRGYKFKYHLCHRLYNNSLKSIPITGFQ